MSQPWMPLYVADYIADTAHLTCEESGAYLALIMHYWRTGGLPDDDDRLARIVKLDAMRWQCVRSALAMLFQDCWKHKRIDAELLKSAEKSGKAKASANKRWSSEKPPVSDANAMPTHSEGNAKAMLSQPQPHKIIDPDGSIADAPASTASFPSEDDRKRLVEKRQLVLRSLGERWNAFAGELGLPQIEEIKPGSPRERAALARVREGCDFDRVFTKIRESPFLRGERGSTPASFDWITNPTNYQKIIEGNYDEIRQATRR